EDGITDIARLIEQGLGESGLTGFIGQDDGTDRFSRIPGIVKAFGRGESLSGHDLAIDAAYAHFRAVRVAPYPSIFAAHAQVNLAYSQRPAAKHGQPALEQFRPGKRFIHQVARSVETTGHHNFTFTLRVHFQVSGILHGSYLSHLVDSCATSPTAINLPGSRCRPRI